MEIRRVTTDLLTPAEERDLARTIEAGVIAEHYLDVLPGCPLGTPEELRAVVAAGERARERFLSANVGLVIHLVRRDGRSSREQEDLFQEGFIGLAEALESYDWARGTPFASWAVPYIRARIAAARRLDRSGIRLSARQVRAAAERGERLLTVASIHGMEDRETTWWQDVPADQPDEPDWSDVAAVMGELTTEERTVLAHRFGLVEETPLTQRDTAAALRLPLTRVRTCEQSAIRYLRDAVAARG